MLNKNILFVAIAALVFLSACSYQPIGDDKVDFELRPDLVLLNLPISQEDPRDFYVRSETSTERRRPVGEPGVFGVICAEEKFGNFNGRAPGELSLLALLEDGTEIEMTEELMFSFSGSQGLDEQFNVHLNSYLDHDFFNVNLFVQQVNYPKYACANVEIPTSSPVELYILTAEINHNRRIIEESYRNNVVTLQYLEEDHDDGNFSADRCVAGSPLVCNNFAIGSTNTSVQLFSGIDQDLFLYDAEYRIIRNESSNIAAEELSRETFDVWKNCVNFNHTIVPNRITGNTTADGILTCEFSQQLVPGDRERVELRFQECSYLMDENCEFARINNIEVYSSVN